MQIQKFYKLWLAVQPFKYRMKQEIRDWHLETCQYISPNQYHNRMEAGFVSPGNIWEKTGDTGLFEKEIQVPENCKGYPVSLEIITGGEALVSVNGHPYQGNDPNHYRVLLAAESSGNETYQINVESFIRLSHNEIGESRFDAASTGKFSQADLCAVYPAAQEFLYDIQYVLELWQEYPQYAAPCSRILTRVFSAFDITDQNSFLTYVPEGRNTIAELLSRTGLPQTDHSVWMIGQSHLDLAWFWRKNETYRKVLRTFTSVLRNMEQFDFYRFMMPQINLFKMLQESSPEVFSEVKEKVQDGKIEIGGLLFVEPDTNLVNGEWLVRQILFGRRFCLDTFGNAPVVESLIDVFGYSGNIPQILKKSGIHGVMVTKMRWYSDTNAFPYSAFLWQGIDGTSLLSATMPGFNYQCNNQSVKYALENNLQPDVLKDVPVFFGWGDGGGGADENHLQGLERLMRWHKAADVKPSGFAEYFTRLEKYQRHLPIWWGEIYQEGHRGCYTSQALSKKLNRQSESLYRSIEFLTGFNQILGKSDGYEKLRENIELILVNQFHDILPGSAVHQVYLDSYRDYEKVLTEGEQYKNDRLSSLNVQIDTTGDGKPIIVWNLNQTSLPALVKIPWEKSEHVAIRNSAGQLIPGIIDNHELVFMAHDLPSMGYEVFRVMDHSVAPDPQEVDSAGYVMENAAYQVGLNDAGQISRLYDKRFARDLLEEGSIGNCLKLYFDYPKSNDAWDIEMDYQDSYQILTGECVHPVQTDALKQWITYRYVFGNSVLEQDIILWNDSNRVDFETRVQWHEHHHLLKSEFIFDINTAKAVYDIPFGVIERDTRPNTSFQKAQFEVPALSLVDLSEGNYGVALMSEHKNGFSVKDRTVGISLLRAPSFPDAEADQGDHAFHYSLIGHTGSFREGQVIHESRILVNPLLASPETTHPGTLPQRHSFLSVDRENVILEALKAAEDGKGLILRLYETYGQQDLCTLSFHFAVAKVCECNLVEESTGEPVEILDQCYRFRIHPFEIKTIRLYPDESIPYTL